MQRRQSLPKDPTRALVDALSALDLAFVDALARRERGTKYGRLARAVSLALRLELDAAALLLEPLAAEMPLARALGDALVGPRARRVTRARTDAGEVATLRSSAAPDFVALLAAVRALLAPREDRDGTIARCRLAEEALSDDDGALSATLRLAKAATNVQSFEVVTGEEQDGILSNLDLHSPKTPLEVLVRHGLAGMMTTRARPDVSGRELQAALRMAEDAGTSLLEARLLVLYGTTFVDGGDPQVAEAALERAEALLDHGELPSLLHLTAQTRGAVSVRAGRYDEAAIHFAKAKVAAREERFLELEAASAMNEAFARIGGSDRALALASTADLSETKLAAAAPRVAVLAQFGRALVAILSEDPSTADQETKRGMARAERSPRDMTADVHVLAAILRVLLGSDAREHERVRVLTGGRHASALYWFDIVGNGLLHIATARTREKQRDALLGLRESLT